MRVRTHLLDGDDDVCERHGHGGEGHHHPHQHEVHHETGAVQGPLLPRNGTTAARQPFFALSLLDTLIIARHMITKRFDYWSL